MILQPRAQVANRALSVKTGKSQDVLSAALPRVSRITAMLQREKWNPHQKEEAKAATFFYFWIRPRRRKGVRQVAGPTECTFSRGPKSVSFGALLSDHLETESSVKHLHQALRAQGRSLYLFTLVRRPSLPVWREPRRVRVQGHPLRWIPQQ